MQIRIEAQHTELEPGLRGWIAERLEELNDSHHDILHARVTVVKSGHHLKGSDEARVVLTLPGKTLSASCQGDTIEDAVYGVFDVIWRELQAFRDKRRQVLKEPGPRPRGRIVRLFRDRGYGFIETESHREVYFHANSVHEIPFEALEVGMPVELDIEQGHAGPQASRVLPLRLPR
ncbi:MAG: hypothetical protein KatS3mg131_1432 [Candidatus Tectimicrobiota bacterium]|nr:MAG: hypothetical protein KatS3mg131_1432 [Candidatus Tectomicrobia bacterium]